MANNKDQHNRERRNSCLADGCYYLDFDALFNSGGCSNDEGGCLNFDGGCFDFDDGCFEFDIFDGCSLSFGGMFRVLVIIGLMMYGDWDYENRTAKSPQ